MNGSNMFSLDAGSIPIPVSITSNVVMRPERPSSNRGNVYLDPTMQTSDEKNQRQILPSWDCKNTPEGVHTTKKGGTSDEPSCWVQRLPSPTRFPHVGKADYSK